MESERLSGPFISSNWSFPVECFLPDVVREQPGAARDGVYY
jgi:hypothetical protein